MKKTVLYRHRFAKTVIKGVWEQQGAIVEECRQQLDEPDADGRLQRLRRWKTNDSSSWKARFEPLVRQCLSGHGVADPGSQSQYPQAQTIG